LSALKRGQGSPEDNQWFCDGVSDNILHSLAQINDLKVISFTSSSTFRDSDKTIPVIAKELGVSYILECSVTLVEGKLKVIAQLIDSKDDHILGLISYTLITEALKTETPIIGAGGITTQDVKDILETGISGIAVSGEITRDFNTIRTFNQLLNASSTEEQRSTFK
jgi:phosphoribosylanthranilate isomerase